jgi:enolase
MARVGLMLYSVRQAAAQDLQGTLREVAGMGYEGVELHDLFGHGPDEVAGWLADHPIVSVEDALAEDDWEHWRVFNERVGGRVQVLGDDLFCTNPARIERGIQDRAANAVLIKVNQIGTVSDALAALGLARGAGMRTVVSARSGETEDAFIADLAVGSAAGQIKIGSLTSSERLAKYNQLVRIQEVLGEQHFTRAESLFPR